MKENLTMIGLYGGAPGSGKSLHVAEEEKEAFCLRWNYFVEDMPEWRRASCGVDSCSRGNQGENECPFLRQYRREELEDD